MSAGSFYVAVVPSPEAVRSLSRACDSLFDSSSPGPGLRLAPAGDWHITLAFLGDLFGEVIDEVRGRLAVMAGEYAPLSLRLAGCGRFDGGVLWAGVAGEVERLTVLANDARYSLSGSREYPFAPHVTLAKSDDMVDLDSLVTELSDYQGPLWVADRVHLMRSASSVGGWGVDESIASWPLTGRS